MKNFLTILSLSVLTTVHAQKTSNTKCYDLKEVLKVDATELYEPHLVASKKFKVKLLENTSAVNSYIDKGKFTKIKKKSRGYRLQSLEYSRPYVVRKAKTFIELMASKFANETKSYFTVTSVTRTLEDQCRLRKVNSNASLGVSSHNYGNSFDISYVRFDGVLKVNTKLEKELERVLEFYRKKGYIHYIKEKYQRCYHVTVRNY